MYIYIYIYIIYLTCAHMGPGPGPLANYASDIDSSLSISKLDSGGLCCLSLGNRSGRNVSMDRRIIVRF